MSQEFIEIRSFAADTSVLAELRAFVWHSGAMMGLSEETLRNIELAVDEAATNVIRHVATHHPTAIGCSCGTDHNHSEVVIEISWEAEEPFNPTLPNKDDISRRIEAHAPGGLGIFLMHHLVDEINFDFKDGKCVVRLTKRV